MPDYEDMILARQEMMEIFEDDPDIYELLMEINFETDELDLWLCGD